MNTQERNLSFLRVTVAAGATETRAVTGARLWILECDGELMVKIGNRDEIPLTMGFKVEEDFGSLTFRNAGTSSVTIDLMYGTGEFFDTRFNVVPTRSQQAVRFAEAPATVWEQIQSVTTPLAAGQASGAQSGAATTARGRRKFCIINNLDATNPLWLVKGSSYPADYLLYVPALTAMRVDTDATFYVHNPNGTAISYVLSHCFYTSPHV